MILTYKGEYYLFSTNQSGFFVSKDLAHWKFYYSGFQRKPIDDDQCAPAAFAIGDTMLLIGSTYDNLPVWYTIHPKEERWKHLCESALLPHWDPDLFLDDDGHLYMYYGSSNEYPLMGVEYDRSNFRPESEICNTMSLHPEFHGWERFGMNNDDSVTLKPFAEGSFMTKHDGKYYLQYAAPGTEFKVYADGVYTSDHPLGQFVYQKQIHFHTNPADLFAGQDMEVPFRISLKIIGI
jgi:beta-xylosidase